MPRSARIGGDHKAHHTARFESCRASKSPNIQYGLITTPDRFGTRSSIPKGTSEEAPTNQLQTTNQLRTLRKNKNSFLLPYLPYLVLQHVALLVVAEVWRLRHLVHNKRRALDDHVPRGLACAPRQKQRQKRVFWGGPGTNLANHQWLEPKT